MRICFQGSHEEEESDPDAPSPIAPTPQQSNQRGFFLSKLTKLTKRNADVHNQSAPAKSVARSGTIGPSAGAALAQLQQQHHNDPTQMNSATVGSAGTGGNVSGGSTSPSFASVPNTPNPVSQSASGEEIKPRSLRFTWSMKTTSSLPPDTIMR